MPRLLAAACVVFSSLTACSIAPQAQLTAEQQATLDIQNNCLNLTPIALETCRRSGANGLSGAGSPGM
jgi:hypothetical protein